MYSEYRTNQYTDFKEQNNMQKYKKNSLKNTNSTKNNRFCTINLNKKKESYLSSKLRT